MKIYLILTILKLYIICFFKYAIFISMVTSKLQFLANFGPSNDPVFQRFISKNFKQVLNTARSGEYDIENAELSSEYLFEDLVNFMGEDPMSPWRGYDNEKYAELLKAYDITGEYLFNYVKENIYPNAPQKIKNAFIPKIKKTRKKES